MRMKSARMLAGALVLCVALMMAGPVVGATYHLAPGGDDAAPGTEGQPWATLEHAAAQVGPGDTVLLAPGEYPGELRPVRSGEAGAPIILRGEPRQGAVLTGVPDADGAYSVTLEGLSDIHLTGLKVRTSDPRGRWIRVHRSERIVLDDLMIEDIDNSLGVHITESTDLRMTGCDIRLGRRGSLVRIEDSRRVVIEGCSFSRGAHDVLLIWPDRTNSEFVLRGNVLHPNTSRSMLIDAVDRTLFEDNIIVRSDDGGRSGSARFAFDTSNSIFRHNRVYANWGSQMMIAGRFRDTLDFKGIRFYANVFDHNTAMVTELSGDTPMIEDCVFANNVFSRNDRFGENRQLRVSGGTSSDLIFTANLFTGPVQLRDEVLSLEEAEAVSEGIFVGNLVGDPMYLHPETYDHRPAPGSPLIDGGRIFTQAVGGGSGTELLVEDSRWFYDGFGIEGERGDEIVVGPERLRARILRINHEAGVLYLDRELVWEDGAAVSLPFSGEAPDIGAYEAGPEGRPTVQVLAEPARVAPGETVTLRAILHGGIEPTQVRWLLGDGEVAEGIEVAHSYASEYDYPVRVAVTDGEGGRHWGAAFVPVESERPADAPLMRTTWGASDEDAWWRWMCYRPMPQAHEFLAGGPTDDGMLRVFAREDGYQLGAQTQPQDWDLDRYPHVMIRYRIAPGTPVLVSVFGWATSEGSRGVRVAQTVAVGRPADEIALEEPLIDDGEWHELRFNAAELLRAEYGDEMKMARMMSLRALNRSLVRVGHEYFLDEVVIGPAP